MLKPCRLVLSADSEDIYDDAGVQGGDETEDVYDEGGARGGDDDQEIYDDGAAEPTKPPPKSSDVRGLRAMFEAVGA